MVPAYLEDIYLLTGVFLPLLDRLLRRDTDTLSATLSWGGVLLITLSEHS